jgi:hypothetical protein
LVNVPEKLEMLDEEISNIQWLTVVNTRAKENCDIDHALIRQLSQIVFQATAKIVSALRIRSS